MRTTICFAVAKLVLLTASLTAGEHLVDTSLAARDTEKGVAWYRAQTIGIEGRGWDKTESYFHRLPANAHGVVRDPVWRLSHQTAGLCLRFATASDAIHARWTLTSAQLAMPHMTATGVSGVDLYVRTPSGWRWLAEGQPKAQSNTLELISGLSREKRQYLLYLPLYNGVQEFELGVAGDAQVWRLTPDADVAKPIVFWGTSITQGACASRPGMAHTAILGRRLERPVINLGFSGNGRMEPEVAELMAEIDAAVFVVDCLPNLTGELVTQRARTVVDILRSARPETPILLVEDRSFPDAFLVPSHAARNQGNREALRECYRRLQADNVAEVYYLAGDQLLGEDGEDTVDGSHPTDLGFMRHAAAFEPLLREILSR